MKKEWKTSLCLLLVLCMVALFLPQGLAAQEQPESPTDLPGQASKAAAPLQQTPPNEPAYDTDEFAKTDVDVINAIIDNNGLNADKDSPEAWWYDGYVTWNNDSPSRITHLSLSDNYLTGTLDVSGLTLLEELSCSWNALTGLNVSGLTALTHLDCSWNQLTGSLDVSSFKALTELECYGNQLTGLNVSGLTKLQKLSCGRNQLTGNLDVSSFEALTELSCSDNQLTGLNVNGLTKLQRLHCSGNQLTGTLDLRDSTALDYLVCDGNQLTGLNVNGLTKLTFIYCYGNQLTGLDLRSLTSLRYLQCENNKLTSLNVTGLEALYYLSCYNNQLAEVDTSGLIALSTLVCSGNQLTGTLDLSERTTLIDLRCENNQLTGLNVSGLTELTHLECSFNQLTGLDASGLSKLEYLWCDNNQLTELNVNGLSALESLQCDNNQLTSLDLTGLPANIEVDFGANELTSLTNTQGDTLTIDPAQNGFSRIVSYGTDENWNPVSGLVCIEAYPQSGYILESWGNGETDNPLHLSLTALSTTLTPNFVKNQGDPVYHEGDLAFLENLIQERQLDGKWGIRLGYPGTYPADWQDTKTNKRITVLELDGFGLTGVLDVRSLEALTELYCEDNQLTGLNVSGLKALKYLYSSGNQLTELDVSSLTELKTLSCSGNQLTGLNVSNLTKLERLYCYGNKLTGKLDVSALTKLKRLRCNNNQLTELNLNGLTALTDLECYNNQLTSLNMHGLNQLEDIECEDNPLSSVKFPDGQTVEINVIGGGQPWLTDYSYDSDGSYHGRYIAKPDPGYGGAWSDLSGWGEFGGEVYFDSDDRAVSATLTFKRNESLTADPQKGKIDVPGLEEGGQVEQGDTFTFTANPITTGAGKPYNNDIQYEPESWKVNPSGDFKSGYTQEFSTKDMALGKHTLTVTYRMQQYNADTKKWEPVDEIVEKTLNFTLVEKITPPDGNTPGGDTSGGDSPGGNTAPGGNTPGSGQNGAQSGSGTGGSSANPITGDAGYAWYIIGLALAGGSLLLLARKKVTA